MFVVFTDYVLVVEAPSSDNASTKVMAHVNEMVVAFTPSEGIAYVADGLTRDFGAWRRPTIDERTIVGQFKQLGLNIRTVLPGHGPAAMQGEVERYWQLLSQ
jgi:glyoxylase-like metal-dependent hydrolase (beta-lactamase superfamily II)